VKRKVAVRELEPALRKAVARGAVGARSRRRIGSRRLEAILERDFRNDRAGERRSRRPCARSWRDALVESEPEKFSLPGPSDLRYNWVHVRLAAIDADEMRELVEDAWAFVVPKRVVDEYRTVRLKTEQ
jgi:hypothetical protein